MEPSKVIVGLEYNSAPLFRSAGQAFQTMAVALEQQAEEWRKQAKVFEDLAAEEETKPVIPPSRTVYEHTDPDFVAPTDMSHGVHGPAGPDRHA
jgi:hypothetical protein